MPDRSFDAPRGVIAPIFTPFEDDGTIATSLFVDHALSLLDAGCVALAPFGTTGEGTSLSSDERIEALAALIAAGVDPAKLIPGAGSSSLTETARLSTACMNLGCAGVMNLPPYYYKAASDEGLYAYFARLIELIGFDDLRLYLYHIPQVAGVGLSVDLVRRLFADFDEVAAIKDSSGDLANTEALLGIEGLAVYPSAESALSRVLPLGAPGCITASANLVAAPIARLIEAWDRDPREASALQPAVTASRLTVQGHPLIEGQKQVKALTTGDERWANTRPPLTPYDAEKGAALGRE
ncbi:MAG: dihydrodipicolinate synthase family protein, partial [Pseudomonadota bacterium]